MFRTFSRWSWIYANTVMCLLGASGIYAVDSIGKNFLKKNKSVRNVVVTIARDVLRRMHRVNVSIRSMGSMENLGFSFYLLQLANAVLAKAVLHFLVLSRKREERGYSYFVYETTKLEGNINLTT